MSIRRLIFFLMVAVAILLATAISTKSNPNPDDELVAGRNVNMVSGTTFPDGDPYLQRQNEPSIAVSTRNPLHLFAGANDYRSINIAMEDQLPGFEGTNQASAPDAWLGVFKSIDGGSTWKSTLLPGFYYLDTTPEGAPPSPLYGFSAAADPVVRAGPNGLFFYAGIVFNRVDRGDSAVFVSRFIDNNNKENVDTTAYIDTQIQARGSSGQFIDKPWLAVDVPYPEAPSIPVPSPDPNEGTQYVTRCNVYLTYSVFLGNPDINIRSKNYFVRSTDSGMTWEKPIKLSETQHINQGTTIAIDPRGNGHVWVAWRRFAHINNKGQIIQSDGIVVVKSEDGGATFTKPLVVAEFAPWFPPSVNGVFDQPTTPVSFRTNDYPTMAVDHNGTAYIAWTQRGLGPTGIGEARIVMTASSDGINWSTPTQVISDTEPVNPDPPGHQLMPQLTYAAEKLTLLWYDHRWDVIQIFLPFIEDRYENVRHTIDVRVAQAEILSYPVFSPSIQVSKYPFLLFHDELTQEFFAYQLFYNKPNLPLFSLGTRPFMGDYIGIAPSPMFLSPEDPNNPTDYWIYNTNSLVPTIYHAVWTDNRDVVHPDETPVLPTDTPDYGEWDQYNAPGEGCVNGNRTGIRNQNIYTSRISEGILAGSPGNTKPLNILRSFVVFVQNMTGAVRAFDLEIIKPNGMDAYFWQEVGDPTETLEEVVVPAYSYVSKTILVEAYSSEYASIIINIYDADSGELVDYVTLNPDSTNPIISEPEGWDEESNPHPRNEGETHTPHPRNYTIIDWNTEQYDPYINTVIPQYDEAVANNDGVTPYSVEVDPGNPHPRNPHGRNPHPRNPHPRNFLLNPHPRNEHITAIEDGSQMTDVVWTIQNVGNTTTSYSINTYQTPEDLPDGILAQLIVFKTYTTPAVDIWESDGCQLVEQENQQMILNLTTPHPRNPDPETPHPRNVGELGDVSVTVPPNGKFYVLYRYYNPYQNPEQQEFHDEEKYEEAVPDIVSDTPDTDGDIIVGPPPKLLVIPPQALLDGIVDEYYSATLDADGGTGSYGFWTIKDPINEDLPDGLSLNLDTGVISGTPQTCGTFDFTVQVNDLDGAIPPQPLQTAEKKLWITIYNKIQATAGTSGSIDPIDIVKVECGASQTFTIEPEEGFEITNVDVDDTPIGAVSTYTFSNVTSNHTIEAIFAAVVPTYTLTVNKSGNGTGTVTSFPAGVDCGGTCSAVYNHGTSVTLTAIPDLGSAFAGWSGDASSTNNKATVYMDGIKDVTANFDIDAPGQIAFSTNRDGDYEIYLINTDGTNPVNLTNDAGSGDHAPVWSSNGMKIAFYKQIPGGDYGDIYVMDADGSNQTNLTMTSSRFELWPTWSPDGTKIAFVEREGSTDDIYVMDADGSNRSRIAHDGAFPRWSPDGTKIAFTRGGDVYVMDADGTNPVLVATSPVNDFPQAWSPDGTKIAFVTHRATARDIYVINADGTNEYNLTDNPAHEAHGGWSPDGMFFTFDSDRSGNYDIFIMKADGTAATSVTTDSADDIQPKWRPIPKNMVYVLDDDDPDYKIPPFNDTLTIIDPSTHTKVQTLSQFNTAQKIGGNRQIVAGDKGEAAVFYEIGSERLLKYNASGTQIFAKTYDLNSIDVAEDDKIYALTDGNIHGTDVLLMDSGGTVTDQASFGGWDIAVDDNSNSVWIVGDDIKRLDKDLVEQFTIDPIGWSAVSVDFTTSGDAWVAERYSGSTAGRLLKISKINGAILETINVNFSPYCLSVDRNDNNFWVACSDGIRKYDENGDALLQIETNRRWTIIVNQYDGSVWVAGYGDVKHYTRSGALISTISGFVSDSQAHVAWGGAERERPVPGAAADLRWNIKPLKPIAQGATWDPFSIKITDQFGNRIAGATDAVTIFPASLGGTLTQNAVDGVATFNDIYCDTPGTISVYGEVAGLNPTPPEDVEVIEVLASVPNPSFEDDVDQNGEPDGWEPVNNNVTFLYPDNFGYVEQRSVGMSCVDECKEISGWRTTNFIFVQPNTEYADSVWYWVNNTNDPWSEDYSGDIGIHFTYYDKHGNYVSGGGGGVGSVPQSTEWEQISGTSGPTPAEYRMVKITLQWNTENASNNYPSTPVEVFFDLIVWEPIGD